MAGTLVALETLRRSSPFAHFSDADLGTLAAYARLQQYPAESAIVRQNDSTAEAYLVRRGSVRIERDTSYGRYLLATLREGDLFGEASFLDHLGRSGDAVAATECELITFSPQALTEILATDARLSLALHWTIWKSLSSKLRLANQHLVAFFSDPLAAAAPVSAQDKAATGQFQIGLAARRQLFEEQRLSAMEINFLATLSKAKQLPPDEVIFREGDAGDRMYIVLEGQVRISKNIPGAGEEALAFLSRGEYFGEMALIDNQPRSAEAKAHTDGAVVLAIPRDVLAGILDIQKVSSLRLLQVLCSLIAKRLREIDEKIVGWFMLSGGSVSGHAG